MIVYRKSAITGMVVSKVVTINDKELYHFDTTRDISILDNLGIEDKIFVCTGLTIHENNKINMYAELIQNVCDG